MANKSKFSREQIDALLDKVDAGSKWTGNADREGLKAIGWTEEDINYYQRYGVNWNRENDQYHKVSEDNKALYGVLTASNIASYKDRIVYLPKIDTSGLSTANSLFKECTNLVAIPYIEIGNCNSTAYMFQQCYSLVCIPELDMRKVVQTNYMFAQCYSLIHLPYLSTVQLSNPTNMFDGCYALRSVAMEVATTSSLYNAFLSCYALIDIRLSGICNFVDITNSYSVSKEAIIYMINNEATANAISIKLNSIMYTKWSTDADIIAALNNHPKVTLAKV